MPYRVTGELVIGGLGAQHDLPLPALRARLAAEQPAPPAAGSIVAFTTQSFACGETVTQSVRLTANCRCGFADAGHWSIGASGIDINLARTHARRSVRCGGSGQPAILNSGGHSDVTIRNGDVVGSKTIRLVGASRNSDPRRRR